MFRHAARLTTVLAGVTVTGLLLVGAPADAQESTPGPVPPPVAAYFPCTLTWTNLIVGTGQDDTIYGTDGNDLIIAGDGDDWIDGGRGRDTIIGGNGDDFMDGRQGNDCLNGGAGNDESLIHSESSNGTDDNYSLAFRYDY